MRPTHRVTNQSTEASNCLNWGLCKQRAQLVELVDSILRSWQLNSAGVVVSNYRESWHGVDAGGPTWRRSDRFLSSFLSPGSQYTPIMSLDMVLAHIRAASIPFLL